MFKRLKEHRAMKKLRQQLSSKEYRKVEFSPKLTRFTNSKDKQNLIRCLEILEGINITHFAVLAPYSEHVVVIARDARGQQVGEPAIMNVRFFKKHYKVI